jgi:O-methyltransferase involved in polyketide biosynthesis
LNEIERVPPGVDVTVPAPARLYDYYLGGKDNFAVDRTAAEVIRRQMPELADAAWANRGFLQRATRWLAEERGIRQFIDIGAGLPTQNNTHQVAQAVAPDSRVVYVDNDPMVLTHARALLAKDESEGTGKTAVITADFRDPDAVLGHQEMRATIDFSEPTALLLVALTHFVSEEEDPWGLVARYMRELAPGSHLALSAVTGDRQSPKAIAAIEAVYANSTVRVHLRSRADIARFFAGLEIVPPYPGAEPTVTYLGEWGADDHEAADSDGSRWGYCAVARRP